jgi:transposase
MTYSIDVRKKVVEHVRRGGSQAEAARRFEVSVWCVRDWLGREDLQPHQRGVARQRKLDKAALRAHVKAHPEALVRERAAHFGVCYNAVWQALRALKITPKKRPSSTKSAILVSG